jgi:rare lipoprotein A
MPIFGLVWVASWVGCFFSSSNDLLKPPAYLPNVSRLQNLNSVNQALRRSRSSLSIVQGLSSIQRGASLFATATVAQGSLPNSSYNQTQSAVSSVSQTAGWLSAVDNLLTLPGLEPANARRATQVFTSTASLIEPASEQRVEKPSPLQNLFFRSWQRVATYTNPTLSQVVVVKPKLAKVSPKENSATFKRRGFWHCNSDQQQKLAAETADRAGFQIWVRGCFVASIPDETQAMEIARNWQQILEVPNLKFSDLAPTTFEGLPAGRLGERLLFQITPELATALNRDSQNLAVEWVNNLRIALKQVPLSFTQAQEQLHGFVETGEVLGGLASWYGPYFHGRVTANGEVFNQEDLTAAHPSLPFGTHLRVTNLNNGRTVIVRINDRGPYFEDRMLDLSHEAARRLNGEETGVFPIEAVVLAIEPSPVKPDSSVQQIARL